MRVLGICLLLLPASAALLLADAPHAAPKKVLLVADVAFFAFDPNAKDLFLFVGPYERPNQGVAVGIDSQGREVRVVPQALVVPAQPDLPQQAQQSPQKQERQQPQKAPPKQAQKDDPVASLRTSCASCHQRGTKTAGGFALFDESGALARDVDWKEVWEEVRTKRMPKPDAGKPELTAAAKDLVRARAEAQSQGD